VKRAVFFAAALLMLAVAGASSAAGSGLVGQWHLDEGSGLVAADSSGQGNDGVLQGDPQWVPGRFGDALSFNGSSGRVRVADSSSLEPASSVTVSAWVKSDASPGAYKYIVAKGATGCIAASYALYTGPSGGLYFYASMNRGKTFVLSPDPGVGIWDGQWHMVVGTFDGSTIRLYVDGNEIGSGTPRPGPLEYLLTDSNDLFIGDYPGCQQHNFTGTIDEVDVWQVALTADQVKAAFDQASTDPPPSQGPGGGGGGTTPPAQGGGTGPAGGSGKNSGGALPSLRRLKISPAPFRLALRPGRHTTRLTLGTTISYTDTQAARSTFVVLAAGQGIKVRGVCTKTPRRGAGKHAVRCVLYTPAASFARTDRAGRNSFRFTGVRGHKLAAGKYLLEVTPRSGTRVGQTLTVPFTIVY